VAFACLGLAVGVLYALRPAPPPPPTVDSSGVDPEVATAVREAREEVLRAPRSGKAWGRYGMVLLTHDFRAEALVAFAEAERLDRREPRWPHFQGVILQRGDPERAVPKLRRAMALSHHPSARLRLAELLFAQGHVDQAEELFRQAEEAAPGNARAELGLAQVARARGDLAACRAHLDRALDGPDAHPKTAHALLAEVYRQLGNDALAEKERKLLADLPDDPGWLDPYARELLALRVGAHARVVEAGDLLHHGQVKEAAALMEQAVRRYPNSDAAWLTLSAALLRDRDYPGVERACREAIRCRPDGFEAHYRLGVALYAQRGRKADAVPRAAKAFRDAIERAPALYPAHFRLGLCLQEQRDWSGAIAAYRAALDCRPDYADAHRQLGTLLAEVARGAAGAGLAQCLVRCPAAIDLSLPLRREAYRHLRAAQRLLPQDAATREALDRLTPPGTEP
jgi:tetratricopeptide (TPR) repeat protein